SNELEKVCNGSNQNSISFNALIDFHQEPISKTRLSAHGCVAARLKMLTYYRVCSAFEPNRALP
ncbi:MAG: hypothetical protein PVF60_01045, partial [Desulfobacterales bacterium]